MHLARCLLVAASGWSRVGRQPRDSVVGFSGKSSKGRWISRISLLRDRPLGTRTAAVVVAPPLLHLPPTSIHFRVCTGHATQEQLAQELC